MEAYPKPTFREALLKLAEWARMLAAGIEECELPDAGFPVKVDRRIVPPAALALPDPASED